MDFPGGSDGKSICLQCGRPRVRSPGQEEPLGEGNGNPLQASCLENPMEAQGSNLGLLHCRQLLNRLNHQGSKNTGVGSHFLLQGTFSTQRLRKTETKTHIRALQQLVAIVKGGTWKQKLPTRNPSLQRHPVLSGRRDLQGKSKLLCPLPRT